MIRSAIRTLIRKRLADVTSTFWTDSEINTYINNGCSDVSFRTKCLKTNGYISAVSCTANTVGTVSNEYGLSSNFTNIYSVNEVYFKSEGTRWDRLEPTSRDRLDIDEPNWRASVGMVSLNTATGVTTYNYGALTGTPNKYYWSREEDVLGIHIPPDSTNAGSNYIRVYYSYKHSAIADGTSGDAESPTIPEPLHLAVVDFGVATGLEDRGWGDKANDYWQKYYAKLHDYLVETNRERDDDEVQMRPHRR